MKIFVSNFWRISAFSYKFGQIAPKNGGLICLAHFGFQKEPK